MEPTTPSSNKTNPFTPSECENTLRRNGDIQQSEDQGGSQISPQTDARPPVAQQGVHSQQIVQPSEKTNSFTPSERETILRQIEHRKQSEKQPEIYSDSQIDSGAASQAAPQVASQATSQTENQPETTPERADARTSTDHESVVGPPASIHTEGSGLYNEATRVTLKPGETSVLELDITPIRASVGEAPRRVIAVSENVPREDVAGITDLVQRLHLTHGPYEIGYYLHAAPVPLNQDGVEEVSRENFIFQLFFDPNGNAVILINLNKDQRVMIQDRVTALSAPATGVVMRHLQQAIVCVGSWTISLGERHILHLAVLPRRYISMPETLSTIVRGAKRALEPSQPATEFKKRNKTTKSTKTANAANGSGATALFQTRAAEPLTSVPQSSTDPVQGSSVSIPLRHPLEMLQVGESVKVADASGGSYTLTRNANVMRNKNTLVFRAHHSTSSSVVVVKLIRTAKDWLDNTIPKDLVQCAHNWTKEAMIHSKLNSHPAVARLLGIDGRFLSLYVEHVDSPNLAWYREATANPHCTLTTRDAKRVLEDMTGALHYIHSQNVIHNDIKPANILYSQDRGAVLIDFGLSAGHATVHDGGSPWYVGPEYEIKGQRGAAGDVFALSVTLLFILGGIPLPELQTPPLQWLISDLRKKQATNKAKDTMLQWYSIIKKAVQQLQVTLDKEATKISDVVGKMLDSVPEQRATVDAILQTVRGWVSS